MARDLFIQTMSGEWIPLQSSIIHRDLFDDIGGFHEWQAGPEDIDLARRAASTTPFAYSPELISAVGMGEDGSSTDWANHSHQSRAGREWILNETHTFQRLSISARDAYWRGRWLRIYLTSGLWNARQGKVRAGLKRLKQTLAIMRRCRSSLFASGFRIGLTHKYESQSFAIAAAEHPAGD